MDLDFKPAMKRESRYGMFVASERPTGQFQESSGSDSKVASSRCDELMTSLMSTFAWSSCARLNLRGATLGTTHVLIDDLTTCGGFDSVEHRLCIAAPGA